MQIMINGLGILAASCTDKGYIDWWGEGNALPQILKPLFTSGCCS